MALQQSPCPAPMMSRPAERKLRRQERAVEVELGLKKVFFSQFFIKMKQKSELGLKKGVVFLKKSWSYEEEKENKNNLV